MGPKKSIVLSSESSTALFTREIFVNPFNSTFFFRYSNTQGEASTQITRRSFLLLQIGIMIDPILAPRSNKTALGGILFNRNSWVSFSYIPLINISKLMVSIKFGRIYLHPYEPVIKLSEAFFR